MSDERRDEERSPTFKPADLVTNGSGREKSFPVILRDSGGDGIGAVYVGHDPFVPECDAVLRDSTGEDRNVRVVWSKKLAEYVHIVGLEVVAA